MKRYRIYFFLLLLLAGGCSGIKQKQDLIIRIPSWVQKTPGGSKKLCAVGASEPTYYKEDGKAYAAENARKELSRSLNLTVHSIMVDVTSEKGGNSQEGTVMEVSSWASEAVLKNSEIVEYWYDESGAASFKRKNITYALACMPLQGVTKKVSFETEK